MTLVLELINASIFPLTTPKKQYRLYAIAYISLVNLMRFADACHHTFSKTKFMPVTLTSPVLIERIQSAFANAKRHDGITLHQAIAMDNYDSDEAVAAARLQDTEAHWTEIPRETLINFESALSFMDEQGTRYYLPAFMIAALEGHIDLSIPFFKITNLMGSLRKSVPEQVITTYGFDKNQILAIANFLRFVVGQQGEKAESQAVLQVVWAWENFVKEQGND